jgi:hypothetical protein
MRSALITIITVLLLCGSVQAAGLTFWGLTEQVSSVEDDNSITARVGYDLSVGDRGGLEPFIGTVLYPRLEAPSVMVIGAIQHLPDLIDPNNPIPFLPEIFLTVINEEVQIRPYIGVQCTVNLVDHDSGFIGGLAGVAIKLTPDARSELIGEVSYNNTFNDLSGIDDNELRAYLGFRIAF